jgi:Ribonuclease G/E
MNERIRELKQMAKNFYLLHEDEDCSVKQLHELVEAKFAELIVKECLTFVRPNSYFQAYPDNMIGGEDGVRLLETITNQIEEHFGVEE